MIGERCELHFLSQCILQYWTAPNLLTLTRDGIKIDPSNLGFDKRHFMYHMIVRSDLMQSFRNQWESKTYDSTVTYVEYAAVLNSFGFENCNCKPLKANYFQFFLFLNSWWYPWLEDNIWCYQLRVHVLPIIYWQIYQVNAHSPLGPLP